MGHSGVRPGLTAGEDGDEAGAEDAGRTGRGAAPHRAVQRRDAPGLLGRAACWERAPGPCTL